ncbi:MAG: ATP-binding protein [Phenylobacterium sp.]|uniref:ATP-binding protein n=1 Tax=Phenylobacterium sp. TaxID=1871053 RepID=UPI00391D373D
MSPEPSPATPPLRRHAPPWAVLLAGGTGATALLALGVTGRAELEAAVLAAAITFGVTLLQALRTERIRAAQAPAARAVPQDTPAEAALPFAAMIEALPDPVLVISAHEPDDLIGRRFVFVNSAARDLLKIQKDVGLLVTVVRDPDVLEVVDEALFGGMIGETAYETGGTQDRVFRALARPLGPAADGARLAMLVFRDETETRRVERTRADFLANASHELRTPLASLAGFIETLRGHAREDVGARDRFLGIMQVQAERMAQLIDDLMSLSRIELNEHVAPAGAVDLTGAVMDVVDAVGPMARRRGVAIDMHLPPRGEAVVVGDRDQILQVVQNLVDNALKYSPDEGAVVVAVELDQTVDAATAPRRSSSARLSLLTPDHAQGRYAVLRVTDSGVGIAREHLPRLTERFYRVEGQKSGERMGTGLGLAIVKHIVNRHRGGLAVESVEGEGTTFTAYFPRPANSGAEGSPSTGDQGGSPDVVMKVS